MTSLHSRKAPMLAAAIFAAATVAASAASLPQSEESRADGQRQIVEAIDREQAENGPFSEGLISPLAALALFYQESGDQALAAGVIERIRQVVRAHYGLYSLLQASLMQRLIAYEETVGNHATALELEEDLLALAERYPTDLRTVPILRQIADNRLRRDHDVGTHLRLYEQAIEVLHRNAAYSSPELRQLEREFIRFGNCEMGRQSYRRLVEYDDASGASLLDRAATLVESADFDLVCSQTRGSLREPALDTYEHAYDLLARGGVDRAEIDRLFAPAIPVVLPATRQWRSGTSEARPGYVDIAFEIGKSGRAKKIKIIDEKAKIADNVKWDLITQIKRQVFRPRLTDGRIDDDARVVVHVALSE